MVKNAWILFNLDVFHSKSFRLSLECHKLTSKQHLFFSEAYYIKGMQRKSSRQITNVENSIPPYKRKSSHFKWLENKYAFQ